MIRRLSAQWPRAERRRGVVGRSTHDEGPGESIVGAPKWAGANVRSRPVAADAVVTAPEPFSHLFVGALRGQGGGQASPISRTIGRTQLGDPGRDGGQLGLDLTASPTTASQTFDVSEVEQAPAPIRFWVRLEQASADIGVERGDLHPEPTGRLLASEHAIHVRNLC